MIATIKPTDSVRWRDITALALGTALGLFFAGYWQSGVVWEQPWP